MAQETSPSFASLSTDEDLRSDRADSKSQASLARDINLACRAPGFGRAVNDWSGPSSDLAASKTDQLTSRVGPGMEPQQRRSDLDAISSGTDAIRNEIQLMVGMSATAQIGLLYPGIGFGPYFGAGVNVGLGTDGDLFIQAQVTYGGGVGTFVGFGINVQGAHSSTQSDWHSRSVQVESNVGYGPSLGVQGQISADGSGGGAGLGVPKLPARYGVGYGAHISMGVTETATVSVSRVVRDFGLSVGQGLSAVEHSMIDWTARSTLRP